MRLTALAALLALAAGCGDEPRPRQVPLPPPPAPAETSLPERIPFDQILVAFEGSFGKADVHRSRDEARSLAHTLFERLRSGADFEVLKQEYSDERSHGVALGPWVAVRGDITARTAEEIKPFPGLAAVLFGLRPGEVGLAEYDPVRCPTGWFIVKRLQ